MTRAIELKERAFAAYGAAAELARWLAFLHGAVHGNRAAANGWMARAERRPTPAARAFREHVLSTMRA